MQKVVRRTILAEKQAARRLAKRKDKNMRDWAKSTREQVNLTRRQQTDDIKKARANRREDYELGPLAPKRDVGDMKEVYGTLQGNRVKGQPIDPRKIAEVLKDVGYNNMWRTVVFVVGDRVVLLEGKDKGKIGIINNIDVPRGECTVEGLNMVRLLPRLFQCNQSNT
jgi:large subunit ribosomal protein L24